MPRHICECGKSYADRSGLYKHKKKCDARTFICKYKPLLNSYNEAKRRINELQEELYSVKQENKHLLGKLINQIDVKDKQLGAKDKQLGAKDKQIEGAGNIIGHQSTSLIKLLQAKASDAPILEYTISDATMKKQIKGKGHGHVGLVILNHFTDGNLHIILGDLLVANYQEEDVKKQSLWTTDVARLTYLIKDINTTGSIWSHDKKGNKVKRMIIQPLLMKVKGIIETYYNELRTGTPTQLRLQVEGEMVKLLHEIGYKDGKNVSVLANKINKYIASHMHFDDKYKLKLEE